MKKVIAIIGSGMMGSALAFPAAENGHEVRLVGTHLDRDIIDECRRSNKHPKFDRAFPVGVKYYQIEELLLREGDEPFSLTCYRQSE